MPTNPANPEINWPAFRHALDQLTRSVATMTDALEALYYVTDQPDAQVLTLDFGASNTCTMFLDGFTAAEADALNESLQTLREDANENTSMANRAKRRTPSRDEYPNQRKPWTIEEETQVMVGVDWGMNYAEIGARLGRNRVSVENHVWEMRRDGRWQR
jgi:DNA-binding NarL/FixJ family response regulator